ncbi:MAG: hypothetical protein ACYTBZ_25830, partial [Planctomycetota bacterium]
EDGNFYAEFKSKHPEKLVLVHFSGNTHSPASCSTRKYFAGHWLYYQGCLVTRAVPGERGESVLYVEDPSLFKTNMGRYGDKNEDLVICAVDPYGKPDYSQAEQLALLAVDHQSKTLRVRRGIYGTDPVAFKKNQSYVAAHVTTGPWNKRGILIWARNYSLACPRDKRGRRCSEVLLHELKLSFTDGGRFYDFDGIEFDVLRHSCFDPRGVDTDGDGKADNGFIDGRNLYGRGSYEFCRSLRELIGEDRLILADGESEGRQRAFGILNGIESEGWPNNFDWDVNQWSSGMNRQRFWHTRSVKPVLNYVNYEYMVKPADKTHHVRHPVPLSRTRLVMAACQMMDAIFCYRVAPPPETDETYGIYDELRRGTAREINWLGKPLADPVQLALRSKDLLTGKGLELIEQSLNRSGGNELAIKRMAQPRSAVKIQSAVSTTDHTKNIKFGLENVRLASEDAVLRFGVRADGLPEFPQEIARLIKVTCRPAGWLMDQDPQAVGIQYDEGPKPTGDEIVSGGKIRHLPHVNIDDEGHQTYYARPSSVGNRGIGWTYWEEQVVLPQEARLLFYTGVRPVMNKTDGVTFRIDVRQGSNTSTVFTHHQKQLAWVLRTVDLSGYSGRTVVLRFLTSAGPAGDIAADNAYWGDAFVWPGADPVPKRTSFPTLMTWADGQWFEATFYYRDLTPGTYTFDFDIEGSAPVYLADLSLHAYPDTMLREFEKGLVLANPSLRPFTFNLAELVPGKYFRRLQGSSKQDPQTNDGGKVGDAVVIPPRDGLFLIRN